MKTITLYFNATGFKTNETVNFTIDGEVMTDGTAANELYNATVQDQDDGHSAYVIAGSAVGHNFSGGLFAFNLESQVQQHIGIVRKALNELGNEKKLTLNLFGHSRGGIATFLMCQGLKDVPSEKLSINVVAIDPVPGNFVWTSYLDHALGLNLSVASRCYDMRNCHNLKNMLVIFSNTVSGNRHPHLLGHAPLLPMFPASTHVTVDVVESNHMLLQWIPIGGDPLDRTSFNTINMAVRFLIEHGTRYNRNLPYGKNQFVSFEEENNFTAPIRRCMHFYNTIHSVHGKTYNNLLHHHIDNPNLKLSHHDYTYHVHDMNPQPMMIKRPIKFIVCAMFLTGLACTLLTATPVFDTQTLNIVSALLGLAAMAGSIAILQRPPLHTAVKNPIQVKPLATSSKDRDVIVTRCELQSVF